MGDEGMYQDRAAKPEGYANMGRIDPNPKGLAGTAASTDRDPWKHRSAGMQCRTCMWFVQKAVDYATALSQSSRRGEVGRCRRHAPTMGGYPVVFMGDWCGDHRLDENRA